MDTRLKVRKINSNIQSLGESVADGKALIASAITNKGVATEAGAAFEIMAANVQKIKNGYTTKSQYIEIFMYSTGTYRGTFSNLSRVDGISRMNFSVSTGSGRQRGFNWSLSGNVITFNVTGEEGGTNQTLGVTGFQIV